MFVKYILFSFNSDKEEIDAFLNQCDRASVKNISVSAESSSNWKLENNLQWEYGEKERGGKTGEGIRGRNSSFLK